MAHYFRSECVQMRVCHLDTLFSSDLSFWYETLRAGSPARSRTCSCSAKVGGGDKNDQVRGLLWHKTRTTIVIKLTLETLAKPVNTQTSRLPPLQLSSREQVTTGVCVERILSLLCKCLLLFTDDRMKAVISMCVCVCDLMFNSYI